MTTVAIISGSPSHTSKTNRVAEWVSEQLQQLGHTVHFIRLRDLPAEDLLYAHSSSEPIAETHDWIRQSRAVIALSPVYKGSYTGILKAYLDLLPEKAFAGKLVVPIVTGGNHCSSVGSRIRAQTDFLHFGRAGNLAWRLYFGLDVGA